VIAVVADAPEGGQRVHHAHARHCRVGVRRGGITA
jgi:hypothetical protein